MGQSEVRWCDRCSKITLDTHGVTVNDARYMLCSICATWLVAQFPHKGRFVAVAKERT